MPRYPSTTAIDELMDQLNKCGGQHCDKPCGISADKFKEEEFAFLDKALKTCKSAKEAKNEEEHKQQRRNYDACFQRLKATSSYAKKLACKKTCEDSHCARQQTRVKRWLRKNAGINAGGSNASSNASSSNAGSNAGSNASSSNAGGTAFTRRRRRRGLATGRNRRWRR